MRPYACEDTHELLTNQERDSASALLDASQALAPRVARAQYAALISLSFLLHDRQHNQQWEAIRLIPCLLKVKSQHERRR